MKSFYFTYDERMTQQFLDDVEAWCKKNTKGRFRDWKKTDIKLFKSDSDAEYYVFIKRTTEGSYGYGLDNHTWGDEPNKPHLDYEQVRDLIYNTQVSEEELEDADFEDLEDDLGIILDEIAPTPIPQKELSMVKLLGEAIRKYTPGTTFQTVGCTSKKGDSQFLDTLFTVLKEDIFIEEGNCIVIKRTNTRYGPIIWGGTRKRWATIIDDKDLPVAYLLQKAKDIYKLGMRVISPIVSGVSRIISDKDIANIKIKNDDITLGESITLYQSSSGRWAKYEIPEAIPAVESNLQKAKRLYTPGTKVRFVQNSKKYIITEKDEVLESKIALGNIILHCHSLSFKYILYTNGKWAEILDPDPIPAYSKDISDMSDRDKLLLKAKTEYPVGTRFKGLVGGISSSVDIPKFVEESDLVEYSETFQNNIILKYWNGNYKACIYDNGTKNWATIIESESESAIAENNLLEQAKKDYPIGTIFISAAVNKTVEEAKCTNYTVNSNTTFEINTDGNVIAKFKDKRLCIIYSTTYKRWASKILPEDQKGDSKLPEPYRMDIIDISDKSIPLLPVNKRPII